MATPPGEPNGVDEHHPEVDSPRINGHIEEIEDTAPGSRTPEVSQQQTQHPPSPEASEELQVFDWENFESRYEAALLSASEEEKAILKEAESLSKYFQAWAAAASSHDDARAVKRLQTRQRFVNLSEEKLSQKQQHYVEVVRAFESALALLNCVGVRESQPYAAGASMPNHDAQPNQSFKVPTVSPDELASFHDAHFSSAAVSSFQQDFVAPNPQATVYDDEAGDYWEEEDDLGYYDDGVKRTLTDEQIEIFRHSELRELERAKEKASAKHSTSGNSSEDPEIASGQPSLSAASKPRDGKRGKKRPTNKQTRREPKPDLRKRTWDVVEAGLDSLDYD
ncbi:hypothetical protein NLG97_g3303 [Lecanicillium saksenae]|uniref:Uncharacterized protein n=1 Tax=Lecanicillium saksenae TaxID=468837 RepID=A0ACC1R076_9HYPO|nr:hypothetical protein NLG97_g3303 [Lecanicillium saksenae]